MKVGRKGTEVRWVMAKASTKKQDDKNGKVWSGYVVHAYPQWANNPLKGLDRCVLTMGAIYQVSTADLEPPFASHILNVTYTVAISKVLRRKVENFNMRIENSLCGTWCYKRKSFHTLHFKVM